MKQVLLFCFLCVTVSLSAQKDESIIKPGRVIFYNTENLFDTIDDPETLDEEFLPTAKNEWNTEKYQLKLKHISKVLSAMLDTVQPLVIGLSEVENKEVLEDLVAQPALKKFDLGIVHHDSPDERGIDVAFLYNKELVEADFDATLKVELDSNDRTRDILYFKVFLTEEFPVWFFVNHWPSRRTGMDESTKKRLIASEVLKKKIDNIYMGEPYARVIVMGDFNDNPSDTAVKNLIASVGNSKDGKLVDLMAAFQKKKQFTLKYKDQSDVFDQFIVSQNLLDSKNQYYVRNYAARIFSPSWLLFNHPKYGLIPDRTYAGGKWVGGYSDHLPVYFDLIFK